jgi:hypothetical protein
VFVAREAGLDLDDLLKVLSSRLTIGDVLVVVALKLTNRSQ